MCIKNIKIISTTVLTCLPFLLAAQQTRSYQDCIHYALEHNHDLKKMEYEMQHQEISYQDAKYNFLPFVHGMVYYGENLGKTIDPNTNDVIETQFFSNNYHLNASLQLFNGFRRRNEIKFEQYNLQSKQEGYKQAENLLMYRIIDTYSQYLINAGMRDIQEQQVKLSKIEQKKMETFIRLGKVPETDKYEIEARLADAQYQLTYYTNRTKSTMLHLKKLMCFPADSILHLQQQYPLSSPFDTLIYDTLFQKARQTIPAIKETDYQLKAGKHNLKYARGGFSPSLSLYSGWNTGYHETYKDEQGRIIPFNKQFPQNRRVDYGLALTIPIFQAFHKRTQVEQAKVEILVLQNNQQQVLKNLEYEVNETLLDWEAFAAEYEMAKKKEGKQEMAYKAAKMKWEKGLISIIDYYESKKQLAQAKEATLNTRLRLFLTEKTIQFYITGTFL